MADPQLQIRKNAPGSLTLPPTYGPNNLSPAAEHELVSSFRAIEETQRLHEITRAYSARLSLGANSNQDAETAEAFRQIVDDYAKHVEHLAANSAHISSRYQDRPVSQRIEKLKSGLAQTQASLAKIVEEMGDGATHHTLRETAKQLEDVFSEMRQASIAHLRGLVGKISPDDLLNEMRLACSENQSLGPLLNQLDKRAREKFSYPQQSYPVPGAGLKLAADESLEILNIAATLRILGLMGAALDMRTLELGRPNGRWKSDVDALGWKADSPSAYLHQMQETIGSYRDFMKTVAHCGPKGEKIPPAPEVQQRLAVLGDELAATSTALSENHARLSTLAPDAPLLHYTNTFLSDRDQVWETYARVAQRLKLALEKHNVPFQTRGQENVLLQPPAVDLLRTLRTGTPNEDPNTRVIIEYLEAGFQSGFPRPQAKWYEVMPPQGDR